MALSKRRAAVFIDKDGTLVENVPHNVDPQKIMLTPRAGPALKLLQDAGYTLFVVTNQPGIAHGRFPLAAMQGVKTKLEELLRGHGVALDGFLCCPHTPEDRCDCRKPKPGMLLDLARRHGIALRRSWMIGDILDDVEAGRSAGCRSILIDNGNETEWVMSTARMPDASVMDLYAAAVKITTAGAPLFRRRNRIDAGGFLHDREHARQRRFHSFFSMTKPTLGREKQ